MTEHERPPHHCVYLPGEGRTGTPSGGVYATFSFRSSAVTDFCFVHRKSAAAIPARLRSAAALRKVIKDQLHSPEFDRLTYAAQLERKQQVLSKLMERYPREVEPYNLWIAAAREDQLLHPELLAGLQRNIENARPRILTILSPSISPPRRCAAPTRPESIRLLEQAQSLSPPSHGPRFELAQIYSSGKFADKAKFAYQLTKFWTACPTSQDQQARWMLVKIPELQATGCHRPSAHRSRRPTIPERLMDYEFLWGLEFRTTSPKDFPQLRQQVGEDVKRLEGITNPHPDADWAAHLISWSQQAGATPDVIRAKEDAIIAKYPHSGDAHGIVRKRWKNAHPEPKDGKDVAAWKSYNAQVEALQLAMDPAVS